MEYVFTAPPPPPFFFLFRRIHTHRHTHAHTDTDTDTQTQTHTHTHTHRHTHVSCMSSTAADSVACPHAPSRRTARRRRATRRIRRYTGPPRPVTRPRRPCPACATPCPNRVSSFIASSPLQRPRPEQHLPLPSRRRLIVWHTSLLARWSAGSLWPSSLPPRPSRSV